MNSASYKAHYGISPASHQFLPLKSKYSPQQYLFKHPESLLPIMPEMKQVTLQFCTFYYFTSYAGDEKTKHSKWNGRKHSLNLTCSKLLCEYNFYLFLLFPNI
jgi:hypothetical protein